MSSCTHLGQWVQQRLSLLKSHTHLAWSSLRWLMWMLWGSSARMVRHTESRPACSGSQPCLWLSQSHASSAHRSWARRRVGQRLQAHTQVFGKQDIGVQHWQTGSSAPV